MAMIGRLLAVWPNRIRPTLHEIGSQASQLGRVVAALRLLPRAQRATAAPVVVLMSTRDGAIFLSKLHALKLTAPIEPHWVRDLDVLEGILSTRQPEALVSELIVANEVFTRFYTAFAARGLAGKLRIV